MLTKDSNNIIKFLNKEHKNTISTSNELKSLYKYFNGIQNNYEVVNNVLNHNNDHIILDNPFISKNVYVT